MFKDRLLMEDQKEIFKVRKGDMNSCDPNWHGEGGSNHPSMSLYLITLKVFIFKKNYP